MEVDSNALQASVMVSSVAAKHTAQTAFAAGGGAVVAAAVVMAATMPKRKTDFFLCIISTVISSLTLGSYVVIYFDLIGDILLAPTIEHAYLILAQIGGIFFAAGLPGWTIVRAFFVWSESHRKSSLTDIIEEAKNTWKR